MAKKPRRFGAHEVTTGPFKGGLHVATDGYRNFFTEVIYFDAYLNRRLSPIEPEEAAVQGILLNLHNLLEYESEEAIRSYVEARGNQREMEFLQRIQRDYITFKSKCDWLRARSLISQEGYSVMEEVRRLRNHYAHFRPSSKRRRMCYRRTSLLTRRSVRRMFVEVELVLRSLRRQSGRRSIWAIVPPGYASEMNWPKEYVDALNGMDRASNS